MFFSLSFIISDIQFLSYNKKYTYRKTSCISRTKSQNLDVPRLVLQLFLPNPLKPGVKLSMKM